MTATMRPAAAQTRRYPCRVLRVIDGDTIDVEVDHGFGVFTQQRVRLAGVNCPELGTTAGRAAKNAATTWAAQEILLTLVSFATKDKYGRRVCDLETLDGELLSAYLLAEGHATTWGGH